MLGFPIRALLAYENKPGAGGSLGLYLYNRKIASGVRPNEYRINIPVFRISLCVLPLRFEGPIFRCGALVEGK